MEFTDVINAIMKDFDDTQIKLIESAIKQRRRAAARSEFYKVSVGGRIRFNDICRPAYLQGESATIIAVSSDKITVDLDREVFGRYNRYGQRKSWKNNITVPVGIYDVIE